MKILARSASRSTHTKITDPTSGFRLIREPLLTQFSINFASNYLGDTYEALVAAGRAGFVVVEIPASLRPRFAGTSSASVAQSLRFILKTVSVLLLHLHHRIDNNVPKEIN